MKLFLFLLFFSQSIFAMDVVVDRILDGDTFQVIVKEHPPELQKIKVRILSLDTPELKGKCEKEKLLALEAKQFLQTLLPSGSTVSLENIKFDKFGGRILATVFISGQNISSAIKENKLGVNYFGKGPKFNWCL